MKFIVDTNVPITANKALCATDLDKKTAICALSCVEHIEKICSKKNGLVLDEDNEIFDEYNKHLSFRGAPGVGDKFFKWVHDNRYSFPRTDCVKINKDADGLYNEFPNHQGLIAFDKSDMKFVAVANAHEGKPKILQAVDKKWWEWKTALEQSGINIEFICQDYVMDSNKLKC